MLTTSRIRIILIVLSILGLGVSSYLAYVYMADIPVRCSEGGFLSGCKDVQKSEFAQFFSIPIPLFGVLFYLFILFDQTFLQKLHRRLYAWRSFFWFVSLVAFLFSLYLTFLEAFVIEAWCIWCIGSGVISIMIFIIACMLFRIQHKEQQITQV